MIIRFLMRKAATVLMAAVVTAPLPAIARTPKVELPAASVKVRLEVPPEYRSGVFRTTRTLTAVPGMKVSVFAAGLSGPRFMAIGPDGTLFVTLPSSGKVVALPDRNKDGVADSIVVFASNLDRPHGIAFRGTDCIVAGTGRLLLLRDTDADLKADTTEVLTTDIPAGGGHWTRTVVVGPDKKLYVSVGSSCNVCVEEDRRRAAVLRFSGPRAEIFATGLRNSVGMAFHPVTHELWAVDNGRDLLGDDLPPEELNKIIDGGDYGWPYCYGVMSVDPDFGTVQRCKDTIPPAVLMQAHSAPLGIAFGTGFDAPKELQEALFIAFHGSWNRTVPTGYKVVAIPFYDGRPAGDPVDFITGWLDESGKAWGRPVGVAVGRDGALYVSDDRAGAIYRVTFEEKKPAKAGR